MRYPTISIILPSFNAGNYIENALTSIHMQTYSNFEVLVIDKCSVDRTVEVATRFRDIDSRFKIVSEQDNGIYDAMNKGIALSSGDWLYFLGADDSLYTAETLQQVAQAIVDNSEIEIFYGNVLLSAPLRNAP